MFSVAGQRIPMKMQGMMCQRQTSWIAVCIENHNQYFVVVMWNK